MGDVPGFELVRVLNIKIGGRRGIRADYRYELTDASDEILPVYEVNVLIPAGVSKLANIDIGVDDNPSDIAVANRIVESLRPA